jgi:hypothetical protein
MALHASTKGLTHELHAVAYSKHRNAQVKELWVALWRPRRVDAGRASRKYQSFRCELEDAVSGDVVPNNFAVHVLFTHSTGDKLGVLRTEVEHKHSLVRDSRALVLSFIRR